MSLTRAPVASPIQIIMSARRKYFYSYDVVSGKVNLISGIQGRDEKSLERFCLSPAGDTIAFYGKDGTAILVSARTKQWMANLKMPGDLRALAWTKDGDLLAGSGNGVVHKWDVRMRRVLWRFADEGSTCVTSLATSANGAYIATGYATPCSRVCEVCLTCFGPSQRPLWRSEHIPNGRSGATVFSGCISCSHRVVHAHANTRPRLPEPHHLHRHHQV